MDRAVDEDPVETGEWRDALGSVLAFEGPERARFLLGELMGEARRQGAPVPYSATTPYLNTIPPDREPHWLAQSRLRPLLSAAGRQGLRALPPDVMGYVDRLKKQRGL